MKVKDFKKLLSYAKDEDKVCVAISEPSIGGQAVSYVDFAYIGFDWDNGKFIIETRDKLTFKIRR